MTYIKCNDLIALAECKKKYELQSLSLKTGEERYLCFQNAICKTSEAIAAGKGREQLDKIVKDYLKQKYCREWFPLSWQKDKAIDKDLQLFRRFIENFSIPEAENVLSNQWFGVEVPVCCNEIRADGISIAANLIIETKNGMVIGIIICRKYKKPFSYRARKKENMVMNSVELLALLAGMKQRYPGRNITVMMIRLCSPTDTAEKLSGFDEKKGDNIVLFTDEEYELQSSNGILTAIEKNVRDSELCDCQKCFYEEVCKPGNKVQVRVEEQPAKSKKAMVFSPTQLIAINHKDGPMRLCAGPGSGKTAVLIERIQRLLNLGVSGKRILAVTFTKKAAQEMVDRIMSVEDIPEVLTLHALAFQILIKHEYIVGVVRLIGKVDQMNLLLRILEDAPVISGVSYEGLTMKYGLISSLLKDFESINSMGVESFAVSFRKKDTAGILEVKKLYDDAFERAGYITFDDQIRMAVNLLEEFPGVRKNVQNEYDYIMVDEVQDLDAIQAKFIQLIVKGPKNNVMVVGDADQSIYSFRGGSNEFMLRFPEIYPETEDVWLQNNYRSSKELVDMASVLIGNNKNRVPMSFNSSFSTGFQAVHIAYFNGRKLYLLIQEILKKGYQYEDIAVIATTNNALSKLREMLDDETARIGVHIPIDRPKFYLREDYVFNVLLDYLTLKIRGMDQDVALYRLLKGMGCEIIKTEAHQSIYRYHLERGLIYNFEKEEASQYLLEEEDPLKKAYGKIYKVLQVLDQSLNQALDELKEFGFSKKFCITEAFEKIEGIIYERRIKSKEQLFKVMLAIKLFDDDTRLEYNSAERNKVHMLTAHYAKGKEFPVVILYDIDTFERKNESEEENRRLLYVAFTRAKRVLFLTESYPGKSQFLKEIADYVTVNRGQKYV